MKDSHPSYYYKVDARECRSTCRRRSTSILQPFSSRPLTTLKATQKQKLLSSSAKAVKVCTGFIDYNMSFKNLHEMCKRASIEDIMKYNLALCLFKIYYADFNSAEFLLLNFNQVLTGRQNNFVTLKSNRLKVGFNSLLNRLYKPV